MFLLCRAASQVGAFINLESTGPGGPDILFQASGQHWMLCWRVAYTCNGQIACVCAIAYVKTFACTAAVACIASGPDNPF